MPLTLDRLREMGVLRYIYEPYEGPIDVLATLEAAVRRAAEIADRQMATDVSSRIRGTFGLDGDADGR